MEHPRPRYRLDRTGRMNAGWSHQHRSSGRGRDYVNPKRMWLRIEAEDRDRIWAVAARKGIPTNTLLLTYIEWGLENDLG